MDVIEDLQDIIDKIFRKRLKTDTTKRIDPTIIYVTTCQHDWIRENWNRFRSDFKTKKFIPYLIPNKYLNTRKHKKHKKT